MKIGYKNLWIEVDINKNNIKDFFNKIKIANKIKKNFTIAFIDERFKITGYICAYSRVSISLEKLEKILLRKNNQAFLGISDLFTKEEYAKYVLFDSGELNGFEQDIPENFDFYIG